MANVVHYAQRPTALVREVWSTGLYARLPQFYRTQYEAWEKYRATARTPHEIPPEVKSPWTTDKYGAPKLACDVPIRVHYPDQCDKGIWGGEGIVEGLTKKSKRWFDAYSPRIWRPSLSRRVFYSEILDKHLLITCTPRTLDLVDEHNGFDQYILKTHPVDLRSQLALDIRRNILLALAKGTCAKELQNRYAKFIIPANEAEWFGLPLDKAIEKQVRLIFD